MNTSQLEIVCNIGTKTIIYSGMNFNQFSVVFSNPRLDRLRCPIGPAFPVARNRGEIRISNIIPETVPSYFLYPSEYMSIHRSTFSRLWARFWRPNGGHSLVPIMMREAVEQVFEVFMNVPGQSEWLLASCLTTPPTINAIIFSVLALSAQCYRERELEASFFKMARSALDRIDNRKKFEYLLAVTLLVSI